MGDSIDRAARVLVVYYSATGHVHALAKAVAEGGEQVGADVRLRHVEELAPEMLISQNQAWGRHRSEVSDEPTASLGDIEWADGIAFGTPTRFGNVAAQLKMFVDQAGQLWEEGKLINNVMTAFTSAQTDHGGQESTILALANTFFHWGAIVLPLGYTVHEVFAAGGNQYCASFTSGIRVGPPDPETMAVAVAQGRRLARVAQVIGLAQEQGLLRRAGLRGGSTGRPRGRTLKPGRDRYRSSLCALEFEAAAGILGVGGMLGPHPADKRLAGLNRVGRTHPGTTRPSFGRPPRSGCQLRDHGALQLANRSRGHRLGSERSCDHLPRRAVEQPDRTRLHRSDVAARHGLLHVRADSAAGARVHRGGDVPAAGPVVDRGHRICAAGRPSAGVLPRCRAQTRAVPARGSRATRGRFVTAQVASAGRLAANADDGGHGGGRERRGDRRLGGPCDRGSPDWLARRRARRRSDRRGG